MYWVGSGRTVDPADSEAKLESMLLRWLTLALGPLPFGLAALHLFFGDGERLADGIVETFGVGVAEDGWSGVGLHFSSVGRFFERLDRYFVLS
jgi:hypothetical protein